MNVEYAKEHVEHIGHEHAPPVAWARISAVIVAALAGALAICEFGTKDAQTSFLNHHIAASDLWAQYQAKSVRRVGYENTASVLQSLPTANEASVQERVRAALANAQRMRSEPGRDGMEQLSARAHEIEHRRDHAAHRYHGLEIGSSGLQLAIVLASVSVVTGQLPLLVLATTVGAASGIYAFLSWLAVV